MSCMGWQWQMRSQVRHWLDLLANARLVPSPIQLLPKLRHIQVTSEHGEQTGVTDNWEINSPAISGRHQLV